jgi:aldehyde dehydrogenase (NAD+)
MVAAVCGDSMLWKPSPEAPLTAIAVTRIAHEVLEENSAPPIFNMILGPIEEVSERMVRDPRFPLISATGSVAMGRRIGTLVSQRLGRTLLELGGNNGIVVMNDADLDLALRAVLFAAVGTAGQRCTTCRRLFLQKGIAEEMKRKLVAAYGSIRIGDPLEPATLMGPLVNKAAVDKMRAALDRVRQEGGRVLYGGNLVDRPGFFVEPTLVEAHAAMRMICEETFAPILYVLPYRSLDEAIALNNDVPQGLSSSVFTRDQAEAERFLAADGSDCGIANVNIGTSGAEIGGAFGGEKQTGGGRESGSDAWRAYMRRATNTINYSGDLPLAQGVTFTV